MCINAEFGYFVLVKDSPQEVYSALRRVDSSVEAVLRSGTHLLSSGSTLTLFVS